jgi:hypothetical protein
MGTNPAVNVGAAKKPKRSIVNGLTSMCSPMGTNPAVYVGAAKKPKRSIF